MKTNHERLENNCWIILLKNIVLILKMTFLKYINYFLFQIFRDKKTFKKIKMR
jgi:hypothetical protein